MGGLSTPLHREAPWKKIWGLQKDGGSWKQFHDMVKAKGPWAVTLTKVAGHATTSMVATGEVKAEHKEGNDEAGEAAERGATGEQPTLEALASSFAKRQGEYAGLIRGCKDSS